MHQVALILFMYKSLSKDIHVIYLLMSLLMYVPYYILESLAHKRIKIQIKVLQDQQTDMCTC